MEIELGILTSNFRGNANVKWEKGRDKGKEREKEGESTGEGEVQIAGNKERGRKKEIPKQRAMEFTFLSNICSVCAGRKYDKSYYNIMHYTTI